MATISSRVINLWNRSVLTHSKIRAASRERAKIMSDVWRKELVDEMNEALAIRQELKNPFAILSPKEVKRAEARVFIEREIGLFYVGIDFDEALGKIEDNILLAQEVLVRKITEIYYRNMVVRNLEPTAETMELIEERGGYPVYAEIRATYITTKPITTIITGNKRRMNLIKALEITTRNVLSFFLYSFRAAQKQNKMIETIGREINVEISKGEYERIAPEERKLEKAIKYVRIQNEQTYKRRGDLPYAYNNYNIESMLLKTGKVTIDNGFIWIKGA